MPAPGWGHLSVTRWQVTCTGRGVLAVSWRACGFATFAAVSSAWIRRFPQVALRSPEFTVERRIWRPSTALGTGTTCAASATAATAPAATVPIAGRFGAMPVRPLSATSAAATRSNPPSPDDRPGPADMHGIGTGLPAFGRALAAAGTGAEGENRRTEHDGGKKRDAAAREHQRSPERSGMAGSAYEFRAAE